MAATEVHVPRDIEYIDCIDLEKRKRSGCGIFSVASTPPLTPSPRFLDTGTWGRIKLATNVPHFLVTEMFLPVRGEGWRLRDVSHVHQGT